jgi:hypothetical protein
VRLAELHPMGNSARDSFHADGIGTVLARRQLSAQNEMSLEPQ